MHRLSRSLPTDATHNALTHIAILCFFFALRSCEVTETTVSGRTHALTLQNLTFRDAEHQPIPLHKAHMATPQSVTIRFITQKNGQKGESRTQSRTNDPELCPVRSATHLVQHILARVPAAPPTTPISTVFPNLTSPCHQRLTNADLLHHLRRTCTLLGGTNCFGFASGDIGTRSLRSGAAMALFLAGHPPANIMLLGRWRSTAFLQYLRPQILEWTSSLSPTMLHTDDFRDADAACPTPTTPPTPPAPIYSHISFHGSQFSENEKNLMACPEKDANPKKEKKKGGKGCKFPINKQKSAPSTSLLTTKNDWPGAGRQSNRKLNQTVFEAARIVDMSEEANERNRLSRKRKPYGTRRNSDSAPQKSYKWTWDL